MVLDNFIDFIIDDEEEIRLFNEDDIVRLSDEGCGRDVNVDD